MNTQPYPEAHFATFPEELPRRCIKAASSEYGCCSICGAPWSRIVEKQEAPHDGDTDCKNTDDQGNTKRLALMRQVARECGEEYAAQTVTTGWKAGCDCNASVVPCIILDPFGGSGTTGKVAKELKRRAVLTDLSEEYCRLAVKRVQETNVPMQMEILK